MYFSYYFYLNSKQNKNVQISEKNSRLLFLTDSPDLLLDSDFRLSFLQETFIDPL